MNHFSKHVLVTEGAGFLGSHPCERLLELGTKLPASKAAIPVRDATSVICFRTPVSNCCVTM